jgi:O-antigen ligase
MISLLAIFTTAIVLTFSRSAWLMFLVVNGFAFWFLPKKIISVVLMLVMLSVVLIPRVQVRLQGAFEIDISASERLSSWYKGLKLFQINPLIGIGYNNVRSVSQENNLLKTFSTDGGNSGAGVDSSWLLVLATTGIMGAILFGYWYINLVVVFLKAFFQSKRRELFILAGLLIAFFINSQFINSLFYPPLMISLFLITGMYFYDVVYKK